MSLLKLILVGMGLLSLVIPFDVTNAGQFTITSSEGVDVITTPEPSGSSSSETKGETWVRKYDDPGQQEAENREALQGERQQQKEAEAGRDINAAKMKQKGAEQPKSRRRLN